MPSDSGSGLPGTALYLDAATPDSDAGRNDLWISAPGERGRRRGRQTGFLANAPVAGTDVAGVGFHPAGAGVFPRLPAQGRFRDAPPGASRPTRTRPGAMCASTRPAPGKRYGTRYKKGGGAESRRHPKLETLRLSESASPPPRAPPPPDRASSAPDRPPRGSPPLPCRGSSPPPGECACPP